MTQPQPCSLIVKAISWFAQKIFALLFFVRLFQTLSALPLLPLPLNSCEIQLKRIPLVSLKYDHKEFQLNQLYHSLLKTLGFLPCLCHDFYLDLSILGCKYVCFFLFFLINFYFLHICVMVILLVLLGFLCKILLQQLHDSFQLNLFRSL